MRLFKDENAYSYKVMSWTWNFILLTAYSVIAYVVVLQYNSIGVKEVQKYSKFSSNTSLTLNLVQDWYLELAFHFDQKNGPATIVSRLSEKDPDLFGDLNISENPNDKRYNVLETVLNYKDLGSNKLKSIGTEKRRKMSEALCKDLKFGIIAVNFTDSLPVS